MFGLNFRYLFCFIDVVVKTVSGKIKSIFVILFKLARTVTSTPRASARAQGIVLNGITCFVVRFSQIVLDFAQHYVQSKELLLL